MASNILSSMLIFIQGKADTSGFTKTDSAIRKTAQNVRRARKEMSLFGKMNQELTRGLSRMFLGGVGIWGALNAGGRYLQFEKDLGAIHSRFYAITNDEKKASQEFDFIKKQAQDMALDIKSTADSYSIFYSSVQKSMGTEGARQVFTNWTKVGRVLHLSEYQMERVTYALREMASKGAIYSQDLRMQIGTHVPNAMGLAQEAAEQMGITGTDWFEKLQQMAKGNSKVTSEFVKRFSANAEKMFANPEALKKALQQPDALAQQFKNLFTFRIPEKFSRAGGKDMTISILMNMYKVVDNMPWDTIVGVLSGMAKTVKLVFDNIGLILNALWILIAVSSGAKLGKAFSGFLGVASKKGILKAMGASGILGGNIIARALSRFGIKALIPSLIRFAGGPWGILISTIIGIVPLIARFINSKLKEKSMGVSEKLQQIGLDATTVYKSMKEHPELLNMASNTPELQKALFNTNDRVLQTIAPHIEYVDHSTYNFKLPDGATITSEEISNVSQGALDIGKKKKEQALDMFGNPKIRWGQNL